MILPNACAHTLLFVIQFGQHGICQTTFALVHQMSGSQTYTSQFVSCSFLSVRYFIIVLACTVKINQSLFQILEQQCLASEIRRQFCMYSLLNCLHIHLLNSTCFSRYLITINASLSIYFIVVVVIGWISNGLLSVKVWWFTSTTSSSATSTSSSTQSFHSPQTPTESMWVLLLILESHPWPSFLCHFGIGMENLLILSFVFLCSLALLLASPFFFVGSLGLLVSWILLTCSSFSF